MKKDLTELVFILDRSGSMSGLEADTIGGFNAMIEKQKKAPGEALIATILFDNVSEVIHDRVNVQDIRPMTDREYSVRGVCACLLKDAADRNDESELRLPCGGRSSDYHYYGMPDWIRTSGLQSRSYQAVKPESLAAQGFDWCCTNFRHFEKKPRKPYRARLPRFFAIVVK